MITVFGVVDGEYFFMGGEVSGGFDVDVGLCVRELVLSGVVTVVLFFLAAAIFAKSSFATIDIAFSFAVRSERDGDGKEEEEGVGDDDDDDDSRGGEAADEGGVGDTIGVGALGRTVGEVVGNF
jgi:hypothetical protein